MAENLAYLWSSTERIWLSSWDGESQGVDLLSLALLSQFFQECGTFRAVFFASSYPEMIDIISCPCCRKHGPDGNAHAKDGGRIFLREAVFMWLARRSHLCCLTLQFALSAFLEALECGAVAETGFVVQLPENPSTFFIAEVDLLHGVVGLGNRRGLGDLSA
jgi:hypothetical protein